MEKVVVSKSKFDEFLSSYPNELVINVTGICEPPLKTYNDFSDGKVWPESVVASVSLFETYRKEEDGGIPPYVWEENVYKIREDLV